MKTVAETVTFRVSRTWCKTLARRISALGIVLLVFLRFCVPEAYETRAEAQRSESASVSIETSDVGVCGTVRLYTCVCVSLQRAYLKFVFMTCFSQSGKLAHDRTGRVRGLWRR